MSLTVFNKTPITWEQVLKASDELGYVIEQLDHGYHAKWVVDDYENYAQSLGEKESSFRKKVAPVDGKFIITQWFFFSKERGELWFNANVWYDDLGILLRLFDEIGVEWMTDEDLLSAQT